MRIEELSRKMEEPDFWDDPQKASHQTRELNGLKDTVHHFKELQECFDDAKTLLEMGNETEDESLIPEVKEAVDNFISRYEELRITTLLSGEYDKDDAILTLHAGAGGTESCDWASMLFRMYTRWAERKGFDYEVIDFLEGDEAGYKSVTIEIRGENAYGYLKSEAGVHRLVRISPFNAAGKRQTSFVSCDVMPDIDEDIEIEINEDDLKIDTYRSSGAGGQHINKTDSAVRMTHIPTGVVAQCQSERSQLQNREQCLRLLRARLFELEMEKKEKELAALEGDQQKIEWGSQIRSYVFHPYNLVKDHRTNTETSDTQGVMDGDINKFIESYLHAKANHII